MARKKKSTVPKKLNARKSFANHNKIYQTKAFGKYTVNRLFKESNVRRDKKGKFAKKWKSIKENLKSIFKKHLSRRKGFDASKFAMVMEAVQKRKAKIRGEKFRRENITNAKRDGNSTSFTGNILYFMNKLRDPKYRALLVKDRAQVMQHGEKNTKQIITNIKQLRDDYGDDGYEFLTKKHFIGLMSSESRNKLLKSIIKGIEDKYNFSLEENFYSMKQYREFVDKNLGDGAFLKLLKEHISNQKIKDFLGPLEFKRVKVRDANANILTPVEQWDGIYQKEINRIKQLEDGFGYEVTNKENIETVNKLNKIFSKLKEKYEYVSEDYLDKLKQKAILDGKDFDEEETRIKIEENTKKIIDYLTSMENKVETYSNRTILGHRNIFTPETVGILSDEQLMSIYIEARHRIVQGNFNSIVDPLILKLEAIQIAEKMGKGTKIKTSGSYEIHHHLQFATTRLDSNETILGVGLDRDSYPTLQGIPLTYINNMKPVFDENGKIKYYSLQEKTLKREVEGIWDSESKREVIIPPLGIEDRIVTAKEMLPKDYDFDSPDSIFTPDSIFGVRNPDSEKITTWSTYLRENFDRNDDLYIDLPNFIHQDRDTDTNFYNILHPSRTLNVSKNTNSINSLENIISDLSNTYKFDAQPLLDQIDNGRKKNSLNFGKGEIESIYHSKIREEIKQIRAKKILEVLENEVNARQLDQNFSDKFKFLYYGTNHLDNLKGNLDSYSEKLTYYDTIISQYTQENTQTGLPELIANRNRAQDNLIQIQNAINNLNTYLASIQPNFPDVDLNGANPLDTNIEKNLIAQKEKLGLPPTATEEETFNALLNLFGINLTLL